MKRPLYEKCKLLKTVLFQTLKSSFIVTLKLLIDFESYFQNKSIFKVTTKIQLCDFCQTCHMSCSMWFTNYWSLEILMHEILLCKLNVPFLMVKKNKQCLYQWLISSKWMVIRNFKWPIVNNKPQRYLQ